ncbi:MAG: ZIP family metal transporter [Eubacteriales bacterium]
MSETLMILIGIMIPMVGTTLGASAVFFLKEEMQLRLRKALLGFASGVMVAASVWSLLLPAIDMTGTQGGVPWLPAVAGFLCGIAFLLLLDTVIPHLHMETEKAEGKKGKLGKSTMLMLAVTLHNIPEGMAVGVVFAGVYAKDAGISLAGAFILAVGIALQNFPEGAVISMPLLGTGMTKKRAFSYGLLSGVVEPLASVFTILLTSLVVPILPYILSFAAGAMIYVVVEELIPEAQTGEHSNIGTIGVAVGFALMMFLDVALG